MVIEIQRNRKRKLQKRDGKIPFCKIPAGIKGALKCDRGQRVSETDDWLSRNHRQIK